ncbi:flagellar biosynthesis protein FliQ [Sporomusa acidovorans]|uniref:Flagellar biosynthetic protein FliQ n=1 Tax=Sporomusa acidovorans (strain ATCC 49682 / DSM 3132 / Mol) TaxID=1123286 RepID=A0ABZ3J3D4_SPOA4|nr:flagellar biosynthesis protein FliQ [Sporomusa acidovorans]OZC20077.1 flagellar biosynthetic protein FliQ [Sporomusa acidovorans DSM 3132]SDD45836.1 flagellar biosynthetic protein FliQ [Sporomusa acidovorans]
MSGDMAIQVGSNALMMVMLVSAPMLILGLVVGVAVSVFQATTQIQEQSLAFIPKIIAVFVAVLIFGPWMLSLMIDYTRELFMNLPNMVR